MLYNGNTCKLYDQGKVYDIYMGEIADLRICEVLAFHKGEITLQQLYCSFLEHDKVLLTEACDKLTLEIDGVGKLMGNLSLDDMMSTEQADEVVKASFTLYDAINAPCTFIEREDKYEVNPEFVIYCKDKGYFSENETKTNSTGEGENND